MLTYIPIQINTVNTYRSILFMQRLCVLACCAIFKAHPPPCRVYTRKDRAAERLQLCKARDAVQTAHYQVRVSFAM